MILSHTLHIIIIIIITIIIIIIIIRTASNTNTEITIKKDTHRNPTTSMLFTCSFKNSTGPLIHKTRDPSLGSEVWIHWLYWPTRERECDSLEKEEHSSIIWQTTSNYYKQWAPFMCTQSRLGVHCCCCCCFPTSRLLMVCCCCHALWFYVLW